jgi:hypothetical protein
MELKVSVVSACDSFIDSFCLACRSRFLATDVRKKMLRRSLKRTIQFEIFVYEWGEEKNYLTTADDSTQGNPAFM